MPVYDVYIRLGVDIGLRYSQGLYCFLYVAGLFARHRFDHALYLLRFS